LTLTFLIGGKISNRNFLLLTSIGRKSGQERVTPIFYMPKAGHFILIASNWGAPNNPVVAEPASAAVRQGTGWEEDHCRYYNVGGR
jgi:hypothetical protein